jgi:hypothetical protein
MVEASKRLERLNMSYIGNYENMIVKFLEQGYKPTEFGIALTGKRELISRHDIDFDCSAALSIALTEKALGVSSTYFFMLSSSFYNVVHDEVRETIKKIAALGHTISVHFDPTIYQDLERGLQMEIDIFESIFKVDIKTISIHRPNDFFLNHDKPICGVEHTYQFKYFKDIKYISDSQGAFRYEDPIDNKSFTNKKSIQLLTHPIWWEKDSRTNIHAIERFIKRTEKNKKHQIALNCAPYKERFENEFKK